MEDLVAIVGAESIPISSCLLHYLVHTGPSVESRIMVLSLIYSPVRQHVSGCRQHSHARGSFRLGTPLRFVHPFLRRWNRLELDAIADLELSQNCSFPNSAPSLPHGSAKMVRVRGNHSSISMLITGICCVLMILSK